jgi:hypothetical protein
MRAPALIFAVVCALPVSVSATRIAAPAKFQMRAPVRASFSPLRANSLGNLALTSVLPNPLSAPPLLTQSAPSGMALPQIPLRSIAQQQQHAQAAKPTAITVKGSLQQLGTQLRTNPQERPKSSAKAASSLRTFWDRSGKAQQGVGPVVADMPDTKQIRGLTHAQQLDAPEGPEVPTPEPSRWQRMRSSTKEDFKSLFRSMGVLRRSLKLPFSWEKIKHDGRAIATFAGDVKRLGWKVIAAVVLYYLVRDSILYLLIPYLVYHGVFG